MRIEVIGGSGFIGSKLVNNLAGDGHSVLAASPSTGVNSTTGAGLDTALRGANVVVDVTNSPSFADEAVMTFFTTSTKNLLRAAADAGVRHYVALSVVGADGLPDSGYLRAKEAQERLIAASGIPYTVVRATQFYEFIGAIAESSVRTGRVEVPAARLQPIAGDDVAHALADRALGSPVNGIVEIAGPNVIAMDECIQRVLAARSDQRPVVVDRQAKYYGANVGEDSLIPHRPAQIGAIALEDWLNLSPSGRK